MVTKSSNNISEPMFTRQRSDGNTRAVGPHCTIDVIVHMPTSERAPYPPSRPFLRSSGAQHQALPWGSPAESTPVGKA